MIFLYFFFLIGIHRQSGDMLYYANQDIRCPTVTIHKEWRLKIKSNKSFEYSILESAPNTSSNTDTLLFNGFWQFYDDTLFLHSQALKELCGTEVKYLRKKEDLYSLGARIDSIDQKQLITLKYINEKKAKLLN